MEQRIPGQPHYRYNGGKDSQKAGIFFQRVTKYVTFFLFYAIFLTQNRLYAASENLSPTLPTIYTCGTPLTLNHLLTQRSEELRPFKIGEEPGAAPLTTVAVIFEKVAKIYPYSSKAALENTTPWDVLRYQKRRQHYAGEIGKNQRTRLQVIGDKGYFKENQNFGFLIRFLYDGVRPEPTFSICHRGNKPSEGTLHKWLENSVFAKEWGKLRGKYFFENQALNPQRLRQHLNAFPEDQKHFSEIFENPKIVSLAAAAPWALLLAATVSRRPQLAIGSLALISTTLRAQESTDYHGLFQEWLRSTEDQGAALLEKHPTLVVLMAYGIHKASLRSDQNLHLALDPEPNP